MTPVKQQALPDFETREVRKAQFKLTKAGDGLSGALSLGPKRMEPWRRGLAGREGRRSPTWTTAPRRTPKTWSGCTRLKP